KIRPRLRPLQGHIRDLLRRVGRMRLDEGFGAGGAEQAESVNAIRIIAAKDSACRFKPCTAHVAAPDSFVIPRDTEDTAEGRACSPDSSRIKPPRSRIAGSVLAIDTSAVGGIATRDAPDAESCAGGGHRGAQDTGSGGAVGLADDSEGKAGVGLSKPHDASGKQS